MDANRTSPPYKLKNELARWCLPPARRDSDFKLAWVNSVCLLFLLIGIAGARRGLIAIKPAPPLADAVPVIVEPEPLPPQVTTKKKQVEEKSDAPPQLNLVIPPSPAIHFSVPTLGSLVLPANLATAPPLEPLHAVSQIGSLNNTGSGGDRPQPAYPVLAKQSGEQGTVVLLLDGDAAGNIVSVEIKESSGFSLLDRATIDFIKRHWRLPSGTDTQHFQSTITYRLQL